MSQKQLSNGVKITAIVSIFVFVVSLIVSIVLYGNYLGYAREYESKANEQKQLQEIINNQNLSYYSEILKNGLNDIDGGSSLIFNSIKGYYKYRLFVNDKLTERSSVEIQVTNFKLTVEEYYSETAKNIVPFSILKYFSYFNTLGKGGEVLPEDDIFTGDMEIIYPNTFEVIKTRDNTYDYKTVITIQVNNMTAGSEFVMFFRNDFSKNFNFEDFSFAVRCVNDLQF